MFFRPGEPHGLRHNPFNAIVVPRPIGWISSIDAAGAVNLAPYSFFNAVAYVPPQVIFSAAGRHATDHGFKDSIANIEATKEFVVNMATWDLREHMNRSSAPAPHGVDEFDLARVTAEPSRLVRPPRVKESPVHLECRHVRTVPLLSASAEEPNTLVVGEVVGIHIADAVIVDGMVDYARMQPIGRLGYQDYARLGEVFAMTRPSWP
ncbi:MAG: flavin reductase family protein [Alphaproteobacteria bacterium]|nr:flavin reductase family protein [Alphaproteobacteria bacterium]